jgi:hypothetical protein
MMYVSQKARLLAYPLIMCNPLVVYYMGLEATNTWYLCAYVACWLAWVIFRQVEYRSATAKFLRAKEVDDKFDEKNPNISYYKSGTLQFFNTDGGYRGGAKEAIIDRNVVSDMAFERLPDGDYLSWAGKKTIPRKLDPIITVGRPNK